MSERIRVGQTAQMERAAAEAEVALQKEALINAQGRVDTLRLQLIRQLNPPGDSWERPVDIRVPDGGDLEDIGTPDERVRDALANRPELRQAAIGIERLDLELVRTRNGLLPRLDFFIMLGQTGYPW